jgi:hypothetical protein
MSWLESLLYAKPELGSVDRPHLEALLAREDMDRPDTPHPRGVRQSMRGAPDWARARKHLWRAEGA